jgi:hypothetical protein
MHPSLQGLGFAEAFVRQSKFLVGKSRVVEYRSTSNEWLKSLYFCIIEQYYLFVYGGAAPLLKNLVLANHATT